MPLPHQEYLERVAGAVKNGSLPLFPNRINVQFAKVISRKEVEILIWERGAGFTLASGSSSSAVVSVMVKKGLTDRDVTVKMPGGILNIAIDETPGNLITNYIPTEIGS